MCFVCDLFIALRIISSQKTQLFGKSRSHLSFLHVSRSVSVCDSQWSLIITREDRLQENRGVRLRRGPVWSRPLWFSCVPATGLKSSDGIRANKETWLSVCHRRMWAKKCGFIFFPLVWSVRFKRNERHTRSCSDYKATKHETGAESVSVSAT